MTYYDLDLSVYELGIIESALRDRMTRLMETRSYQTDKDQENIEQIDAFNLELIEIKQKIRNIISER